jgi:hypothetical protein
MFEPAPTLARIAVVAPLRRGTVERARELVAAGPPFDPTAIGLTRHAVFVSPREVVFLFEGPDVLRRLGGVIDDMAISASFAAWGPILTGTPRLARQAYGWECAAELEPEAAW